MKPSGIEWIGDIPDDWEVRKVKRLFSYQKGKNAALLTKEYISLHPGEYPVLSGQTENDGILGYYESYEFDLDKDSIFVTTVGAKAMSTRLVNAKFSLSQNCALLHKIDEKSDVRFLHYALFPMFEWQKSMISLIMQPSLRFEDLDKATLPYPPIKTQQKIANYLDDKCGEIDATIAKQKESIEKLKAYKQSLISETVTKGLDKSAPLKPSGIDYLGDIPSHWEIKKLKFLVSLIDNKTKDGHSISLENIESGTGKLIETENTYDGEGISFKENDLLFGKLRPYLAKIYLSALKGRALGDFYVMRANKGTNPNFLKFVLLSDWFIKIVDSSTYGTKMPRASWDFTGGMRIPLPPISEQDCISSYLEIKCSEVDIFIIEKQNIIQKLDAYKKSLIFECVTGKKIRVI